VAKELEKQGKHIERSGSTSAPCLTWKLMKEIGYCHGLRTIEAFFGAAAGARPPPCWI